MGAILLILIFIRPFISSLAFPELNFIYSLALLAYLAIWIITRGMPVKMPLPLKFALSLFCLAVTVSMLSAKNMLVSANEIYKYITAMLLFIIASSFNDKERINIIKTITLAGLVISLAAIYQYYFGFRDILNYIAKEKINSPFAMDLISRRRVFFPFVTPNTLAGFLVMVIPLALTLKGRAWFLLPILAALFLTKSLGGLFCLLMVLCLYYYLRGKTDIKKVIFLAGVMIITAIIAFNRLNTLNQYTHPLFSSLMRWNYWKQTMAIIISSPAIGIGLGNFNIYLSRYAHNSYLQIWAEMGIIGLAGFIGIVFLSFSGCVKKSKPLVSGMRDQVTAGLLASSAAFLIYNIIDFSFFLPEVSLVWWLVLGLMRSS
jgi:putative inorganic carbon (hco3(-)) transporter